MATRAVPAQPFEAPTPSARGRDEGEQAEVPGARGPDSPTQPAERVRSATPPRDALFYLEAGGTGLWSPGPRRVGPALDALLSLRFRPDVTTSVSLVGLIPLLTSDVNVSGSDASVDARTAQVEVQTFAIGGFADLHMPFDRVELSAGLGAMALFSAVRVLDPGDLFVQADTPPTTQRLAALLGRVGVAWSVTRDIRLMASIMGGLAVKDLKIEADREVQTDSGREIRSEVVASWGRPLLMGTLSVELALPWER